MIITQQWQSRLATVNIDPRLNSTIWGFNFLFLENKGEKALENVRCAFCIRLYHYLDIKRGVRRGKKKAGLYMKCETVI